MAHKSAFDNLEFLSNLRQSGHILSQILQTLKTKVIPGMTGLGLEEIAQKMIREANAKPAFQNFQGYPFALCVSINEEVVHAFPDERPFKIGDIITVDLGVDYKDAISDAAFTIGINETSLEAQRVIQATEQALEKAILSVKAGVSVFKLGKIIEKEILRNKCQVVKDLCGHGCGWSVHDKPYIFNFPNRNFPDSKLFTGQVICIEPIASTGLGQIKTLRNGWTIVTTDGSIASQSEKMLLVMEDGCEILAGI
ncbi:MAG: type I methionyl aminopeptidase [Patescibacteria group bacterium]|nr:type I methionyl aminopeptidase [Patescibacteria group bacterium]